jgi:outer membrane protein insertion porin family
LGPIALDFAVPVLKESFDKVEQFRFSFGTRF